MVGAVLVLSIWRQAEAESVVLGAVVGIALGLAVELVERIKLGAARVGLG